MKKTGLIYIFMAMFIAGSCAGNRQSLRFKELKHPASMTAYLKMPDGQFAAKDQNLQTVKQFKYEAAMYSLLYSYWPLSDEEKISRAMNKAIEKEQADGMINVKIASEQCFYNTIPGIHYLPVVPGCVIVYIEGEVVKLK